MSSYDAKTEIRRYLERRRAMGGEHLFTVRDPDTPGGAGVREPRRGAGAREAREETSSNEQPREADAGKPPAAVRDEAGPPIRIKRVDKGEGVSVRHGAGGSQGDLFGVTDNAVRPSDLSDLDYESLEKRVATCTLCPLCEGRTKTVFGSGDPRANIIFIGEAPGREEDLQGMPFVGRAGQLLTKILTAVGLTRDEVYITNILKCRPPENRDPSEKETQACKPYLERQIELIKPVLICALGRVAGQNLLERNASLSILRQHIHYYDDVRTVVTYHPAALLRNPNLKRAAWEDIQEVRRIYDETLKDV
jgi:uracil-DNA glycosylase family 4